MTFFYDLNKRLAGIANKSESKQLNERDMSRAAKGYEKYGKEGMEALAKAGREGKNLDPIRDKYNKYDKSVDEGQLDELSPQTLSSYARKSLGQAQWAGGVAKSLSDRSKPTAKPERSQYRDTTVTDPEADYGREATPYAKLNQKRLAGVRQAKAKGADVNPGNIEPYDWAKKGGYGDKNPAIKEQDTTEASTGDYSAKKARAGEDIGRPGKQFAKIAKDAAERYGSKERGEKVAGAVLAKLRKGVGEAAKPDYIDLDKDGNRTEPMKTAARQAKKGPVDEVKLADLPVRQVKGRAYGAQPEEFDQDDQDEVQDKQPKKAGRPKGTGRKLGAKGPTGRSKLMNKDDIREADVDIQDQGEYGMEGDHAKDDIHTLVRDAQALEQILGDSDDLPEWVQAKLTKAKGMISAVNDYMQTQNEREGESEMPLREKAVSVKQRRAAGIAHAAQKGDISKSALRGASKAMAKMPAKELTKFAKTKERGLPEKKAKEEVEETTTSGSMATAPAAAPKKSKGGMQFGKGIYDSMNRDLEAMISESMSINISSSTDGSPSVSVTATDEDAMKLSQILKAAGIGSSLGGEDQSCPSCGGSPCGCAEKVDENKPDWPTNTETSDDALQYSGGLNKPKTDVAGDGQTTVPVTAVRVQGVAEGYDDEEDNGQQRDEGFFVAIGNERDGGFVGMINKDGGKWRETAIDGDPPHNWGGSYMSYLTTQDVMHHIKNDYRNSDVGGPFDSEEKAKEYAYTNYGLGDSDDYDMPESVAEGEQEMAKSTCNMTAEGETCPKHGMAECGMYEDEHSRILELAGITKQADEGNLFTGNLAKARAAGKTHTDLDGDGDMEKVRESSTGDAPISKMSDKDLADYCDMSVEEVKRDRERAEEVARDKTDDLKEGEAFQASLVDMSRLWKAYKVQ